MKQQEFYETILRTLHDLGIQYMLTGSVGAMIYGEPRLTNDMDIVVELRDQDAERLAVALSSREFYCPPADAIRDEIRRCGLFNILHTESGSKVYFVIRKETEHARTEFQRRVPVPFTNTMDRVTSATAEDVIISKLMFYQSGGSTKHIGDIKGILAVSGPQLDLTYIEHWVDRLSLGAGWQQCCD